ncbi:uncharacterized protein VTP21DRAFT_2436 [Calcarisporiella thermophila]|uniref:uncharacterized protein n=1 Tax=Calcarisporiella thermophila TaxID=911321 RepID=UPI0037435163
MMVRSAKRSSLRDHRNSLLITRSASICSDTSPIQASNRAYWANRLKNSSSCEDLPLYSPPLPSLSPSAVSTPETSPTVSTPRFPPFSQYPPSPHGPEAKYSPLPDSKAVHGYGGGVGGGMERGEEAHPPAPSPELAVGDRVVVGAFGTGILRFLGPTQFKPGVWAGVELDRRGEGKNDGSVDGVRYFKCKKNTGIFVKPNKISKLSFHSILPTRPGSPKISPMEPAPRKTSQEAMKQKPAVVALPPRLTSLASSQPIPPSPSGHSIEKSQALHLASSVPLQNCAHCSTLARELSSLREAGREAIATYEIRIEALERKGREEVKEQEAKYQKLQEECEELRNLAGETAEAIEAMRKEKERAENELYSLQQKYEEERGSGREEALQGDPPEMESLRCLIHQLQQEISLLTRENASLREAHEEMETEFLALIDEVERMHPQTGCPHSHPPAASPTPEDRNCNSPSMRADVDQLRRQHAKEVRELRARIAELERTHSREVTALHKDVAELETLVEAKLLREAELEEELAKARGLGASPGANREPEPEEPEAEGFCEVCEERGHDLMSCPAMREEAEEK